MIAALYHNSNITPDNGRFDHTRDLTTKVCVDRDWTLGPVFRDFGSGRRTDRPGLSAILDAADAGAFDVLIVETASVLSRDVSALSTIIERLGASGISIYGLEAPVPRAPQLVEEFRAGLREALRREQRRRVLANQRTRK